MDNQIDTWILEDGERIGLLSLTLLEDNDVEEVIDRLETDSGLRVVTR